MEILKDKIKKIREKGLNRNKKNEVS